MNDKTSGVLWICLSSTITVLILKMIAMPHSLYYTSLLPARLDRTLLPLTQLPVLLLD